MNENLKYKIDFVIPQGEVGPVGPAPELEIGTVTTGAPGSQASVTITPVE